MARSIASFILVLLLYPSLVKALNIEAGMASYIEEDQISVLGVKKDINTVVYGFNFTSTYLRKNQTSWFFSGGFGRANSENKNDDVTFKQSNILVTWGMVGPVWRLLDEDPKVAIGVSLPLMYRVVNYQIPAINTEFPNIVRLMPGLGLDMAWAMSDRFVLTQRLTLGLGVKGSSLWQAGVRWRF